MSYKYFSKSSTDHFNKTGIAKSTRCQRNAAPKKVLPSKKLGQCSTGKSCSDGIITEESKKPKKSTQSEVRILTKVAKKPIDYCKRCGDHIHSSSQHSISDISQSVQLTNKSTTGSKNASLKGKVVTKTGNCNPRLNTNKSNCVKQYYKNENFKSTMSLQDTEAEFRKVSLDTIKEVPEVHTMSESGINIYNVLSDSEEEIGFLDTNDVKNIKDLKKFREENYFECHSVKSRVENKGSVTNLVDHKCVYRFYLNDRLFPVPISTDHHDTIRCVECHLPINLKMVDHDKTNGTIQAKVKLNDDEAQDMILFLPVKDSLIIKEKRKQIKAEEEVLYFGIVKLDNYGNSVFNSNLPSDSLALKYQKGYHEYGTNQDYKYKGVAKDDIIII